MSEVVILILGVVLGGISTLLTTTIIQRNKIRKNKRDALRRLDWMISEVYDSADHKDAFKFKEDWHKELEDLAKSDREWLDELYMPIKRISWLIRDHTFDHEKPDSSVYCCDELFVDLNILQLKMLPFLSLKQEQIDARLKKSAHDILLNISGGGRIITDPREEELKEADFIKKWNSGKPVFRGLRESSAWWAKIQS